jgi:salicylate hydroxylase
VLLDGCRREGVLLENDRLVTSIESDADGATIDVESGQRYRARLVVGADGLHSTMRKYFVDEQPIYSGFVAYRSAVPIHQVSERANREDVQLYIGPGIHLVQYPVRTGLMYNQVAVFRSDRFIAGEQDWGTPDELRQMFAGTCAHVSESVGSLWTDQRWLMCDLEPLDSWVAGRLVLLGDAAHPMLQYLAQGACQAFEDVAALADCLGRHTPDGPKDQELLTKALKEYADLRRPRTAQVQRWARSWGDIWHTDGVGALLRNELFARRGSAEYRETDWLWGGQSPNGLGSD